jgi:hypothetical protein
MQFVAKQTKLSQIHPFSSAFDFSLHICFASPVDVVVVVVLDGVAAVWPDRDGLDERTQVDLVQQVGHRRGIRELLYFGVRVRSAQSIM